MSKENIQILLELVGSAVCGKDLPEEVREWISPEIISEILRTAKLHDIDHLVALGLKKNGLITESNSGIERIIFKAIYRYQQLNFEYKRLCDALEASKIPFIPLKGSVLRKYYREPWMRTSCDIDVLVKRENLDYAVKYLTENLKYEEGERATHDVSLFSPAGIHVELHFDLVEEGRAQNAIGVLSTVWDDVSLAEGFEYRYEMSDEFFYFYHIAHMAKHFEVGGCGIRPFIDLWILDRLPDENRSARDGLLSRGGLLKFAEVARKLKIKKFSDEAVKFALSVLKKNGYLDEASNCVRIAERELRSKHYGKRRILSYLLSHGYEREAAEDAVNRISDEEYRDALRYTVERKFPRIAEVDRDERQKAIASLMRLGFATSEILGVIKELRDIN